MKRLFSSLFSFVALAVILSGCSQIGGGYETEDRGEIVFTPMLDAATKAPVSGFANGNTLVVAATYEPGGNDPSSGARNYFPATTFTHNGTNATSSGAYVRYWPLSSTGSLDFLAYACPVANVISSGNFNGSTYAERVVVGMNDNYSLQGDVLIGSQNAATSNSNATITFKHAQSYVCFNAASTVAYNSGSNQGITITGIALYQTAYSGTVTATRALSDGAGVLSMSWSGQGTKRDAVSIPGFSNVNLSGSMQALGSGIMVPTQASTGQYVIISYTLHNGASADVNMQYKYDINGTTWAPANQYNYNFTFNLNSITVTTSINGWAGPTNATPSI